MKWTKRNVFRLYVAAAVIGLLGAQFLAPVLPAFGVANTSPIFTKAPAIGFATISAANTDKDGGGTVVIVFTADATNGSRCEKMVFQPTGTSVATVARIFINNGSATTSPANNVYYADVTLPSSTVSEVASMPAIQVQLDLPLPPSYRLFVTLGTVVAAYYQITAVCGTY
jgi:hypothetical protein